MNPTVILADDHKIVRDGLRVLLERDGRYVVGAEAANGRELIAAVDLIKPQLVLTDLVMPHLNGLEATRQLRRNGFLGGIVILSQHESRQHVASALAAGVDAYVLKDHAFAQVLEAAAAALRRRRWLSPQLSALIAADGKAQTLADLLTPREFEVLQLIGEGQGTKEVAASLHLSPKTVEVHRLNLMAKLKVNSAVGLARVALREGICRS